VDVLIGVVLALLVGYGMIRLGEVMRRRGTSFDRRIAWALGLAAAFVVWVLLLLTVGRYLGVPHAIYDGLAIGLGVGIYQGFSREGGPAKKG
jgi:hypothetical protein